MQTMTIGKKISLTCVVLVTFTFILGTVAATNIWQINSDVHSIVEGPLRGIYSMGLLQGYQKDQKAAMVEHIAADSLEQKNKLDSTIADLETKFQAELIVYGQTVDSPKGRELLAKMAPTQENVNRVWAKILPLSRALETKEAMALWTGESVPPRRARAKLIDEMREVGRASGETRSKTAIAAGEAASFWSVFILVLSIISGGLLAFFIVRGINKVLNLAVTNLGEGADQVANAAGEISSSSQSLAQGASEQAASLEETSASSLEMSSMTRKNAENSQQAAEFMNAVSQSVIEANSTLGSMMASMREIGVSSNKISKIIKVIDEIAFQTNILALNAAVEAARAGEAGMGFAVVADEVRNLAQRSAQAAKDTASLIEESILKSEDGSAKLVEVASSIQAITECTNKVKLLVDEVDASSKEQALGIGQISEAVAQMDLVTQKTAASAEESASASEELSAQSQELKTVVEHLQALIGAGSGQFAVSRKPIATKRTPALRPAQSTVRLHTPKTPPRKETPASVGAVSRNGAEFPLDDSEAKEF